MPLVLLHIFCLWMLYCPFLECTFHSKALSYQKHSPGIAGVTFYIQSNTLFSVYFLTTYGQERSSIWITSTQGSVNFLQIQESHLLLNIQSSVEGLVLHRCHTHFSINFHICSIYWIDLKPQCILAINCLSMKVYSVLKSQFCSCIEMSFAGEVESMIHKLHMCGGTCL
jgi:hypothetical protein